MQQDSKQLAPMVREVHILQNILSRQQPLVNHIIVNHIIKVQVETDRPLQHKGQLSKEVLPHIIDPLRVSKEATVHRQLHRQEVVQATEAVHLQEVLQAIVVVLLVVVVRVLQAVVRVLQVVLQVEAEVLQVEGDKIKTVSIYEKIILY